MVGTRAYIQNLLDKEVVSKFLLVGIAGAIIDNLGLVLLVEIGSLVLELAAVVSKELSIASMFVINEYWTFSQYGSDGHRDVLKRFAKSNVIRLLGVAVGILVLSLLYRYLGVWYVLANVIGICVGFLFNYTLESLVTWKTHE